MKFFFLLFTCITGSVISLSAQIDSAKNAGPVIYDTIIVEKPPVVIHQTVYYKEVRDSAKMIPTLFLGLNLVHNFFDPSEYKKDGFTFSSKNSFAPELTAGYSGKVRIKTGMSIYKTANKFEITEKKDNPYSYSYWHYDTLDVYYKAYGKDTSWFAIVDSNLVTKAGNEVITTRYQASRTETYIALPLELGIPIRLRKFIFTSSVAVSYHKVVRYRFESKHPERFRNYSSDKKSFITYYASLDISYPLYRMLALNSGVKYSWISGKNIPSVPFTKNIQASLGLVLFLNK